MTITTLQITGLDCMDCAKELETAVAALPGVEAVDVRFFEGTLKVHGDINTAELHKLINKLGYHEAPHQDTADGSVNPAAEPIAVVGFWRYLIMQVETRLALIAAVVILASFIVSWLGVSRSVIITMQIGALFLAGWPIARSGFVNLWINRTFNINFLMTVAGLGALAIGEYAEAATLILLFDLAEALEGFTNERARGAISQLKALSPTHAIKLEGSIEHQVLVVDLVIGDIILVSPGERIPVDGIIIEGHSEINQAPITGESMPVWKEHNDPVFSGTVNGSGRILVEVTRLVGDSTLNRIIEMVTEAQSRQSRSQKFIDKFAQYYTPAMVILAVLMAAIPPLLFGAPFLNPSDGGRGWLYRALALLVISCPCALVISTPVTMVASLTKAAREGVLFKGGIFVEALARINVFAFDKTGTLTLGEPRVVDSRDLECQDLSSCEPCDDLLALAYALERHSTHPLAQAIIREAEERGLTECYPAALKLVTRGGLGLEGQINGHKMTIGSLRMFEKNHQIPDVVRSWVRRAEEQGRTAMLLCDGDRVRGFIAVADTLRPESQVVIGELNRMKKHTLMLTGDNAAVASAVGASIGLADVRSNLLPGDKQRAVEQLRESYGAIAMVGDGINDAPALAAANIGIAMGGSGSAQAMETADVVLMADNIHQLPYAIRLSGFANRLIKLNIGFSLGSKLLVAIFALLGYAPLWLAVLADMGVSLLVTANGLRALRFKG